MNHQISRKRAIGTGLLIGVFIGLIAMFSIRCGKEDPSSPVSFTPAAAPDLSSNTSSGWFPPANGGTSGTNPTPAPSDPDSPAKSRYSWKILDNQGNFRVEITSTGATSGRVGVACYENPERSTGAGQIYFSSHIKDIVSGSTRTVQAKIPECEAWQCDAFEGDPITTDGDVFYGRRLIVGRSGRAQGSCEPPPPPCPNPPCNPPPSCDLEQLGRDAAAECDANNFTLNVEACTFECNPPPQCDVKQLTIDAKSACTFGVKGIDFIECTFECNPKPPCEPHGEPECQEQTWDTNSCTWVGECEPECDVEQLDADANAAADAKCEFGVDFITLDVDECTFDFGCLPEPPCEPGEEEITNFREFFEGECVDRVHVTITEFTDICTQETRQERVETPAPEVCEPPDACIYEYGGPPADKEALCLALTDNSFWSDGSQHCVIPLPGISADKWNLTPGQSHPECLRKQDD